MSPSIDEAVIKRIERRHAAGESYSSIARRENVSISTVKYRTRHLPRRVKGNHPNPEFLTGVKDLSAKGLTQKAIAQELGLHVSTVRRYQRANGAEPRPAGRPRKTAADTTR